MRCLPTLDGYYITCSKLRKTVIKTRFKSEQNTRLNLVYLSAVKRKEGRKGGREEGRKKGREEEREGGRKGGGMKGGRKEGSKSRQIPVD